MTVHETVLQIVEPSQVGPDATDDDVAAHCRAIQAHLLTNTSLDATVRPQSGRDAPGTWVGDWRNGRQIPIRCLDDDEREPIDDALDAAWEYAVEYAQERDR
jgi:hypothetical protein